MFGNPANQKSNEKQEQGNWTEDNWLKSRFHFAFAENYRGRKPFGVLRVLNDDLVQPARGFGGHPHANMEIVTLVVSGFLTHQDSMGTSETLGRGSVQFMTAGKGVMHSEFNLDEAEPLRFLQIWIDPRQRGLAPNYGSYAADPEQPISINALRHLVSDTKGPDTQCPVRINQDLNLYSSLIEPGQTVEFDVAAGRQIYVVQVEGQSRVSAGDSTDQETTTLDHGDSGDLVSRGPTHLRFAAQGTTDSFVVVLEMAEG
jgi:quercetin 2,3-dioxygenase